MNNAWPGAWWAPAEDAPPAAPPTAPTPAPVPAADAGVVTPDPATMAGGTVAGGAEAGVKPAGEWRPPVRLLPPDAAAPPALAPAATLLPSETGLKPDMQMRVSPVATPEGEADMGVAVYRCPGTRSLSTRTRPPPEDDDRERARPTARGDGAVRHMGTDRAGGTAMRGDRAGVVKLRTRAGGRARFLPDELPPPAEPGAAPAAPSPSTSPSPLVCLAVAPAPATAGLLWLGVDRGADADDDRRMGMGELWNPVRDGDRVSRAMFPVPLLSPPRSSLPPPPAGAWRGATIAATEAGEMAAPCRSTPTDAPGVSASRDSRRLRRAEGCVPTWRLGDVAATAADMADMADKAGVAEVGVGCDCDRLCLGRRGGGGEMRDTSSRRPRLLPPPPPPPPLPPPLLLLPADSDSDIDRRSRLRVRVRPPEARPPLREGVAAAVGVDPPPPPKRGAGTDAARPTTAPVEPGVDARATASDSDGPRTGCGDSSLPQRCRAWARASVDGEAAVTWGTADVGVEPSPPMRCTRGRSRRRTGGLNNGTGRGEEDEDEGAGREANAGTVPCAVPMERDGDGRERRRMPPPTSVPPVYVAHGVA